MITAYSITISLIILLAFVALLQSGCAQISEGLSLTKEGLDIYAEAKSLPERVKFNSQLISQSRECLDVIEKNKAQIEKIERKWAKCIKRKTIPACKKKLALQAMPAITGNAGPQIKKCLFISPDAE